jgi:hypothetical protein
MLALANKDRAFCNNLIYDVSNWPNIFLPSLAKSACLEVQLLALPSEMYQL